MINTTQEIIDSLKKGKMVIIMDDENRENEGDLVIASEFVKPKDINFMASHGRGLICMTLIRSKCKKLGLPLMKNSGESARETNFTVSIDAASGITTGISAADRAKTIRKAVDRGCKQSELVQPGHVFPLMAKDGGVLVRAGHTEAGCDLAKLAGLEPSSVIVEILKEDGTMARKKDLIQFAKKYNLKIGTIEDLIKYKTVKEKTIKKIEEKIIKTSYGDFNAIYYMDILTHQIHFVLIKNKIDRNKPTMVRVHVQNVLIDTIKTKHSSGWSLDNALNKIAKSDQGAFVFISHALDEIQLETLTRRNPQKNSSLSDDYRTVGIGAQILNDIGVKDMVLLSRPIKYRGINAFGLNVIEYMSK